MSINRKTSTDERLWRLEVLRLLAALAESEGVAIGDSPSSDSPSSDSPSSDSPSSDSPSSDNPSSGNPASSANEMSLIPAMPAFLF